MSPSLFDFYAEYIMESNLLKESEAQNKIAVWEIWIASIIRWHQTNGWKTLETKAPSDEGEREEWQIWIKTQYKNK